MVERRKEERRKNIKTAKKHLGIEKRMVERRVGKPRPKKPGLPKRLR